ncbi:ClpD chaperone, Hsp100 family [Scenedesmus sp. NREL 46B-D3]|nr:ClpD chaperone, Hsp100 family [Scenedesmus sp. NREL 46B-D3]
MQGKLELWEHGKAASKFSERSIKLVMIAQQEAKNMGALEVTTEHVLLGLIAEDTSSKHGFMNSGLTAEKARAVVETLSGRRKPISTHDNIPFSREVRKTFEAATNECKRSAVSYISPEHILLAMLNQSEATGKRVFESLSIDVDLLRGEALKRLKGDAEEAAPKRKKSRDGPKALDEFCRDLCEEVRMNKIDPVIGREREVARVMQILARRTKNNPILLGEPGVGKTAIAEGLAYAVVHEVALEGSPLPAFLRSKRVLQLDVGLLMAGAKERGELENRVTRLIQECRDSGDVILMIDEVHTIVGTGAVGRGGGGGGGGGLDISNLMKPALARGELQCIGATTLDEHRKHIEKDPALERRFQPVYVLEPNEEDTLAILQGLAERYERHHHCVYSEEALEAAVKLSHTYIADRFLPDKAIDLIDEAGSRVRISAYNARKVGEVREDPKVDEYLQDRVDERLQVMETKDVAVRDGLYEEAQLLRRRQQDYKSELAGLPADGSSLPVVRCCDIEAVVAAWSGVPVERLSEDEMTKLLRLGPVLKERIIGQDDAVDSVVSALCRARVGLKDPHRPAAAMLLVGPTGVGKTELSKVLAEQYFGTQDAIIRLDMSEYMERHSVSKLIGAPPGYVGYGEGGKLTEAVRRRPCSIVLFDEIEKAHPDVFSILLQIMEDGRLTDSQGRTVSFKNTLVLLTSNIGSRVIAATGSGLPVFGSSRRQLMGDDDEADAAVLAAERARMRQLIHAEVKAYFRPELLNRFDEQIVFHKLGLREVRRIADIMLAETKSRVATKGVTLAVGPRLLERIVRNGYSLEYGVRPLRQTITHMIDDVLADCMLHKAVQPGDTAFMELSRRTGEPVCVARSAGEALELTEAEDGGPLEEFTVVRAGRDGGVGGDLLLQRVADGGGSKPGVGPGGAGGADAGRPAWVLATGGLEDRDGSSN